jgi:DnaJ family protein C protein 25
MAAAANRRYLLLLVFGCYFVTADAFIEGLYCGKENCYDVLGVTRAAERSQIVKAYRKLARQWHPDRHKEENRQLATETFQKIANAYEILRDEEQRKDYDYMLDNHGCSGKQTVFVTPSIWMLFRNC